MDWLTGKYLYGNSNSTYQVVSPLVEKLQELIGKVRSTERKRNHASRNKLLLYGDTYFTVGFWGYNLLSRQLMEYLTKDFFKKPKKSIKIKRIKKKSKRKKVQNNRGFFFKGISTLDKRLDYLIDKYDY